MQNGFDEANERVLLQYYDLSRVFAGCHGTLEHAARPRFGNSITFVRRARYVQSARSLRGADRPPVCVAIAVPAA